MYVPTRDPRTVCESGHPASASPDVTFLRNEPGAAVYRIASGRYVFTALPESSVLGLVLFAPGQHVGEAAVFEAPNSGWRVSRARVRAGLVRPQRKRADWRGFAEGLGWVAAQGGEGGGVQAGGQGRLVARRAGNARAWPRLARGAVAAGCVALLAEIADQRVGLAAGRVTSVSTCCRRAISCLRARAKRAERSAASASASSSGVAGGCSAAGHRRRAARPGRVFQVLPARARRGGAPAQASGGLVRVERVPDAALFGVGEDVG